MSRFDTQHFHVYHDNYIFRLSHCVFCRSLYWSILHSRRERRTHDTKFPSSTSTWCILVGMKSSFRYWGCNMAHLSYLRELKRDRREEWEAANRYWSRRSRRVSIICSPGNMLCWFETYTTIGIAALILTKVSDISFEHNGSNWTDCIDCIQSVRRGWIGWRVTQFKEVTLGYEDDWRLWMPNSPSIAETSSSRPRSRAKSFYHPFTTYWWDCFIFMCILCFLEQKSRLEDSASSQKGYSQRWVPGEAASKEAETLDELIVRSASSTCPNYWQWLRDSDVDHNFSSDGRMQDPVLDLTDFGGHSSAPWCETGR